MLPQPLSKASKHTANLILYAVFTLTINDVKTLKLTPSLTSVCFHLSCVPSGFTKGSLWHVFSISAATQEEKP